MKRVAAQPSVLFSDDIVQDGKVSPAHRGRAAHGSSAQGAMAGGDGVSLPSMRVGLRRGRALCQLPVTHFARSSHLPRRPPPQRRRQRGCRPELMSTVLRRSLSLACDDLAPCCRPPDLHRGNGRPHGWDLSPWARRPNVDTTSLSPPCLRFTRSAPSHSPAKRKTRTCCSHTVRIDPPTCSCLTIQPPALTVRAAAGPADRMRCHRTLQRGARPRNPPSKTGRRARRHRAAAVPAADHLTSFARRARGRAPGIEKGYDETARARPVFAEDSGKPHLSADQLSRTVATLSRRPGALRGSGSHQIVAGVALIRPATPHPCVPFKQERTAQRRPQTRAAWTCDRSASNEQLPPPQKTPLRRPAAGAAVLFRTPRRGGRVISAAEVDGDDCHLPDDGCAYDTTRRVW
jgi:hypothetical protein